ncbi:hypothetical protein P3T18_006140 [Paraburkholderia sp. GAS199]
MATCLSAPTPVLVVVGALAILAAQSLISISLGGLLGYPLPDADPFAARPYWLKVLGVAVIAPFFETLVFQWALIGVLRGPLRRSWFVAGCVSALIFGLAHGHTDWRAVRMVATAAILAAVFIIEARRAGPAFKATFFTHALFNSFTLVLYATR